MIVMLFIGMEVLRDSFLKYKKILKDYHIGTLDVMTGTVYMYIEVCICTASSKTGNQNQLKLATQH